MHISRTLLIILGIIFIAVLGAFLWHITFRGEISPSANYFPEPILNDSDTSAQVQQSTSTQNETSSALQPKSQPPKNSTTPESVGDTEVMAWIYPGNPTCSAAEEYSDGRKIDVLKPEYFRIDEGGELTLLTEKSSGCNGYSPTNVSHIKKYSKEQYVTVASSYSGYMEPFLDEALQSGSHIDTLVSFVVDNGMTGVEIDFEDFGGWDKSMYDKYKKFVALLGNALHAQGKKFMLDGPATSNQTEENWYVWRYRDFADLPVDKIVVMIYDYQYDHGAGEPVAPADWTKNVINWTLGRYPYKSKLSVGLPSYGYKGAAGSQKFSLLTYDQIKKQPGFANAVRDPESHEMTWRNGSDVYFYQDSQSLSQKLQIIKSAGINSTSVWHLGGNLWFAKN